MGQRRSGRRPQHRKYLASLGEAYQKHHPSRTSADKVIQLARFEKHLYNYLTARGYTAPNPHSDFE